MVISNRPVMKKDLIDGRQYWLGAVKGIYDKNDEKFILGNCYVYLENVYRVYEILDDPEEISENE